MNQMAVNQNQKLIEKYSINPDHLDYAYVAKCEDPKELKHIIQVLESGEDGNYPKLLEATEARLRQIKPNASILNRKLSYAQNFSDKSNRNEMSKDYEDEVNDIQKWIQKSNKQKRPMKPENTSNNSCVLTDDPIHNKLPIQDPPVLDFIDLTQYDDKPLSMFDKKKYSNHNKSLDATYSNWDKYDPDIESMKLDNKEKLEKLELQRKSTNNGSGLLLGTNNTSDYEDRSKCMKTYVENMFQSGNSNFSPLDMALREKELGNEYFKSNDYAEALCHYNTSINIHSTLEAKNNRAMAFLKLKKYEKALDDLRQVVEKDPKNVKAHYRRGLCFKSISMNCLALRSFEATLKYECNNLNALKFVKELKNLVSNILPKNLIRVREISRHYDQTVWDIEHPFYVTHVELNELIKERVEYLYEADPYGCLTECVCSLCPWYEWQLRKKKWSRHKVFKNEEPRKRWQLLTLDIVPILLSKSLAVEVQRPKRLNITDTNSAKINGHRGDSMIVCDGLHLKPVSSVKEFLQSWKTVSQKNNKELYNKLLRNIKPKDLPYVLSKHLDEEILSKFLETLNQNFDPDSELDLISEYLTAMTKVERFDFIVKMLDNKVKEDFQPLVKRVHCHTKNNMFLTLL